MRWRPFVSNSQLIVPPKAQIGLVFASMSVESVDMDLYLSLVSFAIDIN